MKKKTKNKSKVKLKKKKATKKGPAKKTKVKSKKKNYNKSKFNRSIVPQKRFRHADKPEPLSTNDPVALEIIKRFRDVFSPKNLTLLNQSEQHKGHNATGGHYRVIMSSTLFVGLSPLQRERWATTLIQDLIDTKKIHALSLELSSVDPIIPGLEPEQN